MNGRVVFSVLPESVPSAWQDALRVLVEALPVPDKAAALEAVLKREAEGSTAIGDGVAVPHAKISGIENIEAVIGRSADGVEMGNEIVHIFLLLLIPAEAGASHVDFLAHAMRMLSSAANRERILNASSSDEILEVFA